MTNSKEIDLIVRAQLKNVKDLESVTKSIRELEKAIDEQSAAAKRGGSSIDELKATLASLQQVQDRLKNQANLVDTFKRLGEQIAKTEERVAKTGKAYDDYRQKVGKLEEATDKQQATMARLEKSSANAQAALERQSRGYADIVKSLREAGIATDDLAGAENRLRTMAAQTGVAIAKTQASIDSYAADVRKARDAEREMADAQAFQKKADDAARLVKAGEYINWWTQELDKIDQAERKLVDDQVFQKKVDDAAKLAKSSQYVSFWTNALAEAEQAQQELAQNKALSKVADEAQAAARGFTTLARAATDLTPKTVSLKDTINAIINPTDTARKSLSGIEEEINTLAASVAKINGPIKNYQATMRSLADANKALASQAGLIDQFQRQSAAVRAARAEFVAARTNLNELAAATRQGGAAGAEYAAKLADAQRAAGAAAQALNAQITAARTTREALQQAGIATKNLANEQARLTASARQSADTVQKLGTAYKKYGDSVERARKSNGMFGDEGRTTLSLLQRIRGEVLALTASYVGLQAAIGLAGDSIAAYNKRQGVQNQLGLSVGNDKAAIDAEYQYVKGQADRIGVEFEAAAKGYAKFSAAARMAGRDQKEIRYIWESFAEVGRVANLSTDELDGVFKALEQITSKGKIQAEELRGQLGDRLFGAFQVAAEALKDTFPDLDKAMENGLVTSDQLIKIAEQYRKTVADQLPAAMDGLAAQQARLNNAIFDFKLAIADAGWADSFRSLIVQLTEFMRSADGQKAAKDIADGFSAIGDAIVLVLQNLDTLKTVLGTVGALFAFKAAASGVINLIAIAQQLKKLHGALAASGVAVDAFSAKWPLLSDVIGKSLGAASAFAMGWQIGTILSEKFDVVRKAGVALVIGLQSLWIKVTGGLEIAFAQIPVTVENAMIEVVNSASRALRTIAEQGAKALRFLGLDSWADSMESFSKNSVTMAKVASTEADKLRAKMAADLAAVQAIGAEMWDEAGKSKKNAKAATAPKAPGAEGTPYPGFTPSPKKGKSGGDVAKREKQIESLTRSLETLEAKIDRAQTDTLSKQLEAVDLEYANLARRIGAMGGKAGAEFMTRLNNATADLKLQITKKFNDGIAKEYEALRNKLEDIDAQGSKRDKRNTEQRVAAIALQYADVYRQIEAYKVKLEQNNMDTAPAVEAERYLGESIKQLENLERIKFATEELNKREAALNDQIALRTQLIATANAQRESGMMSEERYIEVVGKINEKAVPAIQAAADEAVRWAMANKAIFENDAQYETFIAKMQAIKAESSAAVGQFTTAQKSIANGFGQIGSTVLDSLNNSMKGLVDGTMTWNDALRAAGVSVVQLFADIVRGIASAIIKQQILNGLLMVAKALGWTGFGNALVSTGAQVSHAGGVVGQVQNRTRAVDPNWFASAPRYHTGGIVGLAPDEYPAILQKNEEVLSASDPRNVLNGGGGISNKQQAMPQDVSITNYVDATSFMAAAAATPAGRKVIMNVLSAERSQLRTLVGAK